MTSSQPPTPPEAATPAPPAGPAPATPSRGTRGARGPILWGTAAVGAGLLLVLGVSAVVAVMGSGSLGAGGGAGQSEQRAAVAGVTALELDVNAAEVTLEYGPVTEATLRVTGRSADRWDLRREADTLRVESPGRSLGGSCFLGFCPPDRGASVQATLLLPEELHTRALDLEVDVAAGLFTADGTFGEVSGTVGAGEMRLAGTATELDLTVEVGTFAGEFTGVGIAHLEVGVGELTARLLGEAPTEVDVSVEVGSATLWLPDTEYRVDSRVELGDIENRLRTAPASAHLITAEVGLGELILRTLDEPRP